MAPGQRRGPWLPEEDQALMELIRTEGANNWVNISRLMQHRTPKQCRERFHQNLKPSLKHDPITAEEGRAIEAMVKEFGKRWAEIARKLGNRSDNAVKNWYNSSVNRKRRDAGASYGSRTANGRVEPPYSRVSTTIRSPGGRYSAVEYGSRRHSLVSSCESYYSDSGKQAPCDRPVSDYNVAPYGRHGWSRADMPDRSPTGFRRQLAPITTLQTSTHTDASLSSPCFSETSNRTSVAPPSMVSDHNSISSASPRTASSPYMLPGSLENRQIHDPLGSGSIHATPLPPSSRDEWCHQYPRSRSANLLPEHGIQQQYTEDTQIRLPPIQDLLPKEKGDIAATVARQLCRPPPLEPPVEIRDNTRSLNSL